MLRDTVKKRLIVAFIIGVSIGVLEIIGGILNNSIALISDAMHIFTDTMAVGMSLSAIILAAKPHTPNIRLS